MTDRSSPSPSWASALAWMLLGSVCAVLFVQTVLEESQLAFAFLSPLMWASVVERLGGSLNVQAGQADFATVPWTNVAAVVFVAGLVGWLLGGALISAFGRQAYAVSLRDWGRRGWKWWSLIGLWVLLSVLGLLGSSASLTVLTGVTVDLWWAAAAAGWLATLVALMRPVAASTMRLPGWSVVVLAMGVYTVAFTWMNWQLFKGLLVPHGDSAMYEEHLWNVTHGKGFRSFLDQGLFLGEHVQVIHLALLPMYLLWPSHLLLELCESAALAATALPAYWIARRHTGSERAAVWTAVAVLLYFPLQYLDVSIDLKTFRPISFGVPLLLLAIDQMERRRWKTMTVLLVATLCAKEDYAVVIAPLGVWLLLTTWRLRRREASGSGIDGAGMASRRTDLLVGAGMAAAATVYLLLAVKVVIPWFRDGGTVHYARYFARFGETPTDIVVAIVTQPRLLFSEIVTVGTLLYGLRVLVPLGGTPLLSPSRLAVGAPLFLLLCLNELAQTTPGPFHHFHAPLLPIVFWATAAGLGNGSRVLNRFGSRLTEPGASVALDLARYGCLCALTTGLVVSIHPMSRKFWDRGDVMHWRRLYVPGERAARFAEILPLIPVTSRVASTDFIHPRLTHHERSYDYSDYLRRVSDYERKVPDDTEFIVIDTRHPYSTMHVPQDVPEFHQHDKWELLTNEPDPWFILLRRRSAVPEDEDPEVSGAND